MARPGTRSPARRIAGVDAARAVALAGMFATHILPMESPSGAPTRTALLFDGRASALFAVLAGVGVALATGGPDRPADARAHAVAGAGLVARGLVVGFLGLLLATPQPLPLVILAYYGLMFVVAVPFLRLPHGALAGLAAVWCVGAPVLSQLLRDGVRDPDQVAIDALADPGGLLATLAVTGVYPVLTWTTYLLAGMAVGRLDLRSPRVAAVLLLGGALLSALASEFSAVLVGAAGGVVDDGADLYGTTPTSTWWWLVVDAPHSGAPLDLARTTGSALAVLGAMLLLARVSAALVWLPAAVGAVPLTLYCLHVLATLGDVGTGEGRSVVLLVHLTVAAGIGALVAISGRRGPLEAVVAAASRRARAAAAAMAVPRRS